MRGYVIGIYIGDIYRVSTDPKKIEAVTEWPRPTTVTEVRSFLGFVSYYRFIPNFSKVLMQVSFKVVSFLR